MKKGFLSIISCFLGELISFSALWFFYSIFFGQVYDPEFDPGYTGTAVLLCVIGLIGFPVGLTIIRPEFEYLSLKQAALAGLKAGLIGFWGIFIFFVGQGFTIAGFFIFFVRRSRTTV